MNCIKKFRRSTFFPLVMILVASAFLSACSREARVKRAEARADAYFEAGEYDKARVEYLNVLRGDRENTNAVFHLAQIHWRRGEIQQALPFLLGTKELAPENLEVRRQLGYLFLRAGQRERAKEEIDAILALAPGDGQGILMLSNWPATEEEIAAAGERIRAAEASIEDPAVFQSALGNLYLKEGDLDAAEASFLKATEFDPEMTGARQALGRLYWRQGKLNDADAQFLAAAEAAGEASAARLQWADFKAKTGEVDAAKEILAGMTNAAPNYLPAYTALAEIAISEKDYEVAAAITDQVMQRDPDNVDGRLLQSRLDVTRGDFEPAIERLETLRQEYPKAPQVNYQLAVASLLNQDMSTAMERLGDVLALDPDHDEAVLLQAQLKLRQGEAVEVAAELSEFIERNPGQARARELLAEAYRLQKNWAAAMAVYEQMESMYPDTGRIPFLMGLTYRQMGEPQKARTAFERAIELSPGNLTAVRQLLELDLAGNQLEQALTRVREQLDANPDSPGFLYFLAQIQLRRNETEAAVATLKRVIEIEPRVREPYLILAQYYVRNDRAEEALRNLEEVLTRDPADQGSLMLKGMILDSLGDLDGAAAAYEALLEANPRFGPAMNNLAYLYAEKQDRLNAAFDLARQARELQPEDPFTADTYGWILYQRGEFQWALSLLEEAATKLPDKPEVLYHLGSAHYRLAHEAAARNAFEQALAVEDDFDGRDRTAARLELLNLAPETINADRLADLEERRRENPQDPILLLRIAAGHENLNQWTAARDALAAAVAANPEAAEPKLRLAELTAFHLDDPAAGLQLARESRRAESNNAVVAWRVGRIAMAAGDYQLALSLLEEAARSMAEKSDVQFALARARLATGHLATAAEAIHRAEIAGLDGAQSKSAHRMLTAINAWQGGGETTEPDTQAAPVGDEPNLADRLLAAMNRERSGDADTAIAAWEDILADFPDFAPAHHRLADLILHHRNDPVAAYRHAMQAREADPDNPRLARLLGEIAYRRGDPDLAVQLLNEAAAQLHDDPVARFFLGMARAENNNLPAARQALESAIQSGLTPPHLAQAQAKLKEIEKGI